MDSVQNFLAAVGVIIGVLALIGGSLVLVKGSYNKARIVALRDDAQDLRNRLGDCEAKAESQERAITEGKLREDGLAGEIRGLVRENEHLTALVTQRADVDKVLSLLADHHNAAMTGQQALTATITALIQVLERKGMTS